MLRSQIFLIAVLLGGSALALAADAEVESFSPEGTVKNVRQVTARFTQPIVPFGDPRLVEPFEVDCPEKGTARWADSRNWVFDFDRNLPAGIICKFRLKDDLKTLDDKIVGGAREFSFSTGGPAIKQSFPYEGGYVDEEQIFILGLDSNADPASILEHAYCDVEGIQEQIGVRFVAPGLRKQLLEQKQDFVGRLAGILSAGTDRDKFRRAKEDELPIVVLQCKQRFPNESRVRLVWGAGIRTPSGVATEQDQALAFAVRPAFSAQFHCPRVNASADCIPVMPMTLMFSAPMPRKFAAAIRMKAENGKVYLPTIAAESKEAVARAKIMTPDGMYHGTLNERLRDETVNEITFAGPFPETASFKITLPANLQDDAGRFLANKDIFPLSVRTDESPPLAKFAARFGVIELHADATLPVTVRNIEATLDLAQLKVAGSERRSMMERMKQSFDTLVSKSEGSGDSESIQGRMVRLGQGAEPEIVAWMKRVQQHEYPEGAASVFQGTERQPAKFDFPAPAGGRAFEVIGIPLKDPGFYVLELASPRLGNSLLDSDRPYFVKTAVLVTNLSAHLKLGRESSLVWVTSLDKGQSVSRAVVEIRDCAGTVHWKGTTDSNGVMRVDHALPAVDTLPPCFTAYDKQYFVTARNDDDFTFTFSNWKEGIESWRFKLPEGTTLEPHIVTSVLDRALLRAGETISMKHVFRRHRMSGFELLDRGQLPTKAVITHMGSNQKYDQPLNWDNQGTAETTWTVPKDAKLGVYQVEMVDERETAKNKQAYRYRPPTYSGSFRVEAYRLPTMKAVLKPVQAPLISTDKVDVDIQLNYLAGGGASGAQVKLRALVQPRYTSFPDYEGFTFVAGNVQEGVTRPKSTSWRFGEYETEEDEAGQAAPPGVTPLKTHALTLDMAGAARVTLEKLPKIDVPKAIQAELEYQDASGEILTSSIRIPLWPAGIVLGLKPDGWAANKDKVKVHSLVLDLDGKPRAGVNVKLDLLQRMQYSHRKRLVGGFYGYENYTEIKRIGDACKGRTDNKGLLICEFASPISGNLIVRAHATDEKGASVYTHQDIWVAGSDQWWFNVSNDDRMDVLPERKRYEPGETATFQVRMPFKEGMALVTVEREGVMDVFTTKLSGKEPIVKIPIKPNYAPNVYVSVLAVRGRVGDVQPTALVDLGKPAYKLGITEINVGWRAHELKVSVAANRPTYKVRERARVQVQVTQADDGAPAKNGEVVLAAVDEALLELMPNGSWDLLTAMMRRRGIEVQTSTAQMHVVGKRHYGRKALAPGGGGGNVATRRQSSRELFDSLLLWKGRVKLDDKGQATVEVPLNDSLSAFRIVAVATAGVGRFGTGQTTINTTQDLMLFSGLPQLVREQDRFVASATTRNASAEPMEVTVSATQGTVLEDGKSLPEQALAVQAVTLAPGEARRIDWLITVPINARELKWNFSAKSRGGVQDQVRVTQKVIPAVRVRTFQATIMQLDKPVEVPVKIPADAIPGRGGVEFHLRARLADELAGVKEYMALYPYTCLEQRFSQAIALRDKEQWRKLMGDLPTYLDSDGLAKYFPSMITGSDTLTSYIVTIAHEAGWEIPEATRAVMVRALTGFVQGRIIRHSSLPTADVALRKVAALNAIARATGGIDPSLATSFNIEPNLWPTSGVLDWFDVLQRSESILDRDKQLEQVEKIIRSRLNFQGTTMGFSTERTDFLWWLMCSADTNANRVLLSLIDNPGWTEDMPRLARGTLGRQRKGHWSTTVANAWGVLAMEKFSKRFESESVTGTTQAKIAAQRQQLKWHEQPDGGTLKATWPAGQETAHVQHEGGGKPWLTIQSLAAIPLKQAFSTGYKIKRSVSAVDQKVPGIWNRGDVYRVRLDIEAQSDMTWVVVHDPIPSGASILGTGLGRDSQILGRGEKKHGWVWAAFEERAQDSFRAYYEFVPKGSWTVEYTVRLNNSGRFELPETRVEALYAPEMFGEIPNAALQVK